MFLRKHTRKKNNYLSLVKFYCVLKEKLIVAVLVNKSPVWYRIRIFLADCALTWNNKLIYIVHLVGLFS